jgi:hypothetical protein
MGADSSPEEACGALAVEQNHEIVKEYQPPNVYGIFEAFNRGLGY